MKAKNVGYIIKKLKFKYSGHLDRTREERWSKRIASWPYENKTNRGRPKTRRGGWNYQYGRDSVEKTDCK